MALQGQAEAMPVIGFLNSGSEAAFQQSVAAFNQGLNESGYLDGQNVKVEYAWAEGDFGRLRELADGLVARGVNVIAASGGVTSAKAANDATPTVPIVYICGFNPADQRIGLGSNTTEVNLQNTDLLQKRLVQFRELVGERTIVFLLNPNSFLAQSGIEQAQLPDISVLRASTEAELEQRFAQAQTERLAILVDADAFFTSKRKFIVALEKKYKVPAAYPWREYAEAGGLISYGPSLTNPYRQLGVYAALALKTAPAALPVTRTDIFEVVINTRAAKAHALKIPTSLILRADKIIN